LTCSLPFWVIDVI